MKNNIKDAKPDDMASMFYTQFNIALANEDATLLERMGQGFAFPSYQMAADFDLPTAREAVVEAYGLLTEFCRDKKLNVKEVLGNHGLKAPEINSAIEYTQAVKGLLKK